MRHVELINKRPTETKLGRRITKLSEAFVNVHLTNM